MDWRTETVRLINQMLWPSWDEATGSWLQPDLARMQALTLADSDLFATSNAHGILDKSPSTPVVAASIPTHRQYFVDEGSGKLGERYFF
ncbi:hypothetical protein [Variovorax paradoxus]|uniref:hypothetical protein n=1 Tax=Variovorax paradoxus TaxID=34073 RepID=UPI003D656448